MLDIMIKSTKAQVKLQPTLLPRRDLQGSRLRHNHTKFLSKSRF